MSVFNRAGVRPLLPSQVRIVYFAAAETIQDTEVQTRLGMESRFYEPFAEAARVIRTGGRAGAGCDTWSFFVGRQQTAERVYLWWPSCPCFSYKARNREVIHVRLSRLFARNRSAHLPPLLPRITPLLPRYAL